MKVKLWVEEIELDEPEHIIRGSRFVRIPVKELEEYQDGVQKELDRQEEENDARRKYSLINEVIVVLKNMEFERDRDGKIVEKKNPMTGIEEPVRKPFDIDTQRIINRILNETDKLIKKYGKFSKDHETDSITIDPSDAIYLAQRMQTSFNEYNIVAPFVEKAYDHFVDIETSALNLEKKDKDEGDEKSKENEEKD